MFCLKGTWRLDLGLMLLYQMTLFFSVQMLFVIFLEYMPPSYCTDDDYCYKVTTKCLTNFVRTNDSSVCPLKSEDFETCVNEKKHLQFRSAQFDYQQGCDPIGKKISAQTVTFLGTLLGNLVLGYLSDTIGRRPVYIMAVFIGIPSLVLSAAIPYVQAYYAFRFLTGFGVAGTLTVGWTYGSELISPTRRFRLRTYPNWANARMLQVGVSWLTGEWRLASYVCAGLSLTILPMIFYLPESPVFLEQKRKYEKAHQAREKLASITQIPYVRKEIEEKPLKMFTAWSLFKVPRLRKNFLVLCWMWFYVGLTMYITDLNGADMSKNLYIGQLGSGLILTVSKIIVGSAEPFFPWLGRRLVFLVFQTVAISTYGFLIYFLYTDQKQSTYYTLVYMVSYASQSMCLESCYLSLAELMPTDVRTKAGAVTNILMKVGSILASVTVHMKEWHEPSLFILNAIICSTGLVLVYLFLEESKNVNILLVGQDAAADDEEDGPPGDKTKDVEAKGASQKESQVEASQTEKESVKSTAETASATEKEPTASIAETEKSKKEEE